MNDFRALAEKILQDRWLKRHRLKGQIKRVYTHAAYGTRTVEIPVWERVYDTSLRFAGAHNLRETARRRRQAGQL